jgi:phosphoglycerol transferase MdoB-like AlkP superfamily enzyme
MIAREGKTLRISTACSLLLLVVASAVVTAVCLLLQPNSASEVISCIRQSHLVFVLNFLPVFMLALLAYFLAGNVFFSTAATAALAILLSMINRYKMIYRDDPFVPMDVFQGAEALSIIFKTRMEVRYGSLGLLALVILSVAAIGCIVRSRRLPYLLRLVGIAGCVVASVGLNKYIYASSTIYTELPSRGQIYYVPGQFNCKGFIYCFLHQFNRYSVEVPAHYSASYAAGLSDRYRVTSSEAREKPHIIMVMNEAFSDLSAQSSLLFGPEQNPLANFQRIERRGVGGHLVVPDFGGGTANTEYDVLTGGMTVDLSRVNTSAFRLVRRSIKTLPRFLRQQGYHTLFVHPGDDWFYNRKNVYRHFGMQQIIFSEAFRRPQDFKGPMVSDQALMKRVQDLYLSDLARRPGTPLFYFVVSIQNHGPYVQGMYGSEPVEKVTARVPLSQKTSEMLSNYMVGVRDADSSLGAFADFLEGRPEPVVLVFFGDHLPMLGENYQAYRELGVNVYENGGVEERQRSHEVPFLIWANSRGRESVGFERAVERLRLPRDRTINASYLGASLYEMLGYRGDDPFFDLVNGLRTELPVFTRDEYRTGEGYTRVLPPQLARKVSDYRMWQYYRLFDEEVRE